jgi:hypothetical protein
MLSDISHVYRQTAKLISTETDKAKNCLHMNTIRSIGNHARLEQWTHQKKIGIIAQDLANIKAGMEHDYVTNTLKGGDETLCITTLSRMFKALVQLVTGTRNDASIEDDLKIVATSANQWQNSILDEISFAKEHLVFKFSVMDPGIKSRKL